MEPHGPAVRNEPRNLFRPTGGHPPQTQLLTDPRGVTEAYAVIPQGRDARQSRHQPLAFGLVLACGCCRDR